MVRRHELGKVFPGVAYRRFYCQLFGVTEPELGFRPPLPGELINTGGYDRSPARPVSDDRADPPEVPPGTAGDESRPLPSPLAGFRLPFQSVRPAAAWTRRSSEVLAVYLAGAVRGAPTAPGDPGPAPPRLRARVPGQACSPEGEPGSWDAVRLAHEWLLMEPPQIAELAAGRHVGAALAERVEGRVRQFRRLDDHVGGRDLIALVERELLATVTMVREAVYDAAVGRRLLSSLAQLCQLAGWVAADAGRNAAAGRLLTGGIRAAHAGGDAALAANLISTHAYQLASSGDVRQGVLLAQTACAGVGTAASATTQAMLADRLAWAHARAGDRRACERALASVERLFDHADPGADPEWVYWLDGREIDVMAGRCWTELSRPERAEDRLRRGLTGYDPLRAREVALYETWFAEVHLLRGDVEAACARATRAARLDARVNSARSAERLRMLARRLGGYRSVRAARDFAEVYRSLLAAAPDAVRPPADPGRRRPPAPGVTPGDSAPTARAGRAAVSVVGSDPARR
ncbi:hypothetical protein [Frankia sp. AgB32]|uniref:hypothetical protein n=1 Tax=Frankia sp. AgB32 TaxID=631119 RepID=UPI00200E3B49|nr:hypothetical protein [Frankia sp. AgB32]MCK9894925.1 hypothetical protein [Frankia sp. AgB32]